MDGWMDRWMDGWIDGWMDRCIYIMINIPTVHHEIQIFRGQNGHLPSLWPGIPLGRRLRKSTSVSLGSPVAASHLVAKSPNYPLVICGIAIENGHRNSGFTH